jgi:hypothetical protein
MKPTPAEWLIWVVINLPGLLGILIIHYRHTNQNFMGWEPEHMVFFHVFTSWSWSILCDDRDGPNDSHFLAQPLTRISFYT